MSRRTPPDWSTGDPEKTGVYLGFSDEPLRTDDVDLYTWNGRQWQHHTGWYDNLVSHWILVREVDVT